MERVLETEKSQCRLCKYPGMVALHLTRVRAHGREGEAVYHTNLSVQKCPNMSDISCSYISRSMRSLGRCTIQHWFWSCDIQVASSKFPAAQWLEWPIRLHMAAFHLTLVFVIHTT